jgi:hypothetical protein
MFNFKWLKNKDTSMKSTSTPIQDKTSVFSELRNPEYEESFYKYKGRDKTRVYRNFRDIREKADKKTK